MATSKKRKDPKVQQLEIVMGESLQNQILDALRCLDSDRLYMSRAEFVRDLDRVLKDAELKLKESVIKAILAALGEASPRRSL